MSKVFERVQDGYREVNKKIVSGEVFDFKPVVMEFTTLDNKEYRLLTLQEMKDIK